MDPTVSSLPVLAPHAGKVRRILLIEDDFETQTAIASLLRDEGYEVDCAANGAEGLLALKEESKAPSLIILDVWMPQMDGVQFRAAQTADQRLARIPVLVTTAVKPKPGTVEMVGVPMLMKPLSTMVLLSAIEQLRSDADDA